MSTADTNRSASRALRMRIDDLSPVGQELSPDDLRLASGGTSASGTIIYMHTYVPAPTCTMCNDTDTFTYTDISH